MTFDRRPDDDPVSQIEEGDILEARLWEDSDARVFTTNPDDPAEGRTFVWARSHWFEREEAEANAAVEFSPLSMDEPEVREWLGEQGLEMTEIDDEFAQTVRDEFLNEDPLYPEAPELSNQENPARP